MESHKLNLQVLDVFLHVHLIFSLAVYGENPRYCYSPGVIVVVVMWKNFEFCNICVITEDMFTISKAIQTMTGDKSKCILVRIMPLFRLSNILSSIKHSTAQHWHLHALLLLVYLLFKKYKETVSVLLFVYTFCSYFNIL